MLQPLFCGTEIHVQPQKTTQILSYKQADKGSITVVIDKTVYIWETERAFL